MRTQFGLAKLYFSQQDNGSSVKTSAVNTKLYKVHSPRKGAYNCAIYLASLLHQFTARELNLTSRNLVGAPGQTQPSVLPGARVQDVQLEILGQFPG